MKALHLLIIDPQRDFCDPDGALSVPGADKDMDGLARMIHRIEDEIQAIHCTLDTHHFFDISHPIFWTDSKGKNPEPFTIITQDDVNAGVWKTSDPRYQEYGLEYVSQLAANHRYPLCVWPPHCLLGTRGHNIVPSLAQALMTWEKKRLSVVDYVIKGHNHKTEHYSAVQADVPDPEDPSTTMNYKFIRSLEVADRVVVAGEALSHCVANTIRDIADAFGNERLRKFVLLEDCMSNVPGFEQLGKDFMDEMMAKSMNINNSIDFLA